MARKSKEEAEMTRLKLLDSALIVMAEKGLVKATLAQIASHAGVTRGAIYWHFKDKADLLDAIWQQIFAPFSGLFEQTQTANGEKLPDMLTEIARLLIQELFNNCRLQSLVKLSHQALADSEYLSYTQAQRAEEHNNLVIAFGKMKQLDRLHEHLNPNDAAIIYTGFLNGIFQQWVINPDQLLKANIDTLVKSLQHSLFKPSAIN
ncbi:TetR family transcriptional regulator [Thaumasiovibrio sp. DFM-14]|uniref:TetR family transcriptional regulator n=1 Tax=Thaumasiovibrio sp. DFM-14 TaxID=3384792 RepID=UPI0039A1861E